MLQNSMAVHSGDMMHKRQYSDIKSTGPCKVCGCVCNGRILSDPGCNLDLHHRIEELQSKLLQSKAHLSNAEVEFETNLRQSHCEMAKLREDLTKLRERYDRLMESHKRMQKINDNLENKLLNIVNSTESEKTSLQQEVASITSRLVEAKSLICDIEEENERYRNDCGLAVQLLQCKPSNFVAQQLDALPLTLQERVKCHLTREQIINLENRQTETTKLIHVPMQTFPPTAMVYSVPKSSKDSPKETENQENTPTVPMSLIAKVLSPSDAKRRSIRTYICVKCKSDFSFAHKETQTSCVLKQSERGNRVNLRVHGKIRSLSNSSTETDF